MQATSRHIGVIMDPIGSINIKKDSTFAMLLAAQRRGWTVYYMEQHDLWLEDGRVRAAARTLELRDDPLDWYTLGQAQERPLGSIEAVLMRKDPPFDMEYVYTTYLLELAMQEGCLVVNRPDSLRDANEKLFTAWFPRCCPPTLVSRDIARLRGFLERQQDMVVKPLDGMGGASVFRVRKGDPNTGVILETVTGHGQRTVMAQRFLPEYVDGDKRILLVDGEPAPYALARIPASGEARANLAAGGRGEGVALTERDRWICDQVAPALRERGLMFVGLDVIGDYLTEINVTSPTCIRELDALYGLDIGGWLMDAIGRRLEAAR
ncbi:glutathione synthase [Thioalkalivibrio thiocyanodenitrificans]|uniref:glutathione synthase n=1 Tax=Thioalkalivibrio thiocyanodenitrificans TaxID=243063 RepID=UPI00037A6010|nr:glutathione synthase [Thioalkalivibrio thiocyanodenitrificans]